MVIFNNGCVSIALFIAKIAPSFLAQLLLEIPLFTSQKSIDSKQTMYIMLGLYGGDKIINSETGKKLVSIVEHELDRALAKHIKKESK